VPYTFFRQQVQAGNVAEITSQGYTVQGTFKKPVTQAQATGSTPSSAAASYKQFQTQLPAFGNNDLLALLMAKGVIVNAKPLSTGTPLWETILLYFGPAVFFIALFIWLGRRAQAAGGGMLSAFGRSRARRYEASSQRTTFADVAGIDEAEEEVSEVVDFLRNPDRYRRLGARIPKGVLLTGPPGTGKTLLARAVAGEANVPFFWLSASEFVEMFVGVGASRVRDLFQQAKSAAPAIIFIDELDAIGRSRSSGVSFGGNDEREQTLNQILTEMDGFTGSEGVIVMAATNRPEVLDQALLRPGRFDRRIVVNPPDQKGRAQILAVHTRDVPLAADVDLDRLAGDTAGMVGADLANLVNEAALLAGRHRHHQVHRADFSDALERLILGSERRIVLSPLERERTAYHESGHALLGMLQPGADPVRKISIVPRGQTLGVTYQSPATERYGYAASYLRGRIIGALGGRAAEELIYGDVTTGAESDLEQITAIARQMVGRWGMSEAVGPVTVMPRNPDMVWPGVDGATGPSDETRKLMDTEVRRIVEECYQKAVALLRENRDKLDRLAHALLENETLDEEEAYAVAGVDRPAHEEEPLPAAQAAAARRDATNARSEARHDAPGSRHHAPRP
jgi:cell division protease FtsH